MHYDIWSSHPTLPQPQQTTSPSHENSACMCFAMGSWCTCTRYTSSNFQFHLSKVSKFENVHEYIHHMKDQDFGKTRPLRRDCPVSAFDVAAALNDESFGLHICRAVCMQIIPAICKNNYVCTQPCLYT